MAKSRKQRLKKQDFQKKKLKVGKSRGQAANATDTSFVAKTITIRNQHLEHDASLEKRLPLLKHHNSSVRKEMLASLHKAVPQMVGTAIMTPLLSQTIPMICDDSFQVREALLELFDGIGGHETQALRLHCKLLVLYINMAMTHIVEEIQADSSKFLAVALKYCGEEICKQSWVKLLSGLFRVLGWSHDNKSASVMHTKRRNAKYMSIHLTTLYDLLKHGCLERTQSSQSSTLLSKYLIPQIPQPYEYLKLFTRELRNKEDNNNSNSLISNSNAQDINARRQILKEDFLLSLSKQLELIIKDGGESGRSANNVKEIISAIALDTT